MKIKNNENGPNLKCVPNQCYNIQTTKNYSPNKIFYY